MARTSVSELEEEVVPRPAALIESLRSFGYSPATSIADLVDNSITAEAERIDVRFIWRGPDSEMRLLDDGCGMSEGALRDAMRAGSLNPLDQRDASDLGRFGLGLKTASFAQARSLTVVSSDGKGRSARRWDLDHVQETNRWALLSSPPPGGEEIVDLIPEDRPGTLVAWHRMDKLLDDRPADDRRAERAFFKMVDDVKLHLEMIFHRFLERGLQLSVNGVPCKPWDPFLERHEATQALPVEEVPYSIPGSSRQGRMIVRPFVLPHRSRLTDAERARGAGSRGWNLQQGFYLYRADRLIVLGGWLGSEFKPEEHHKLARIGVEIDQQSDALWALDVRKSRARPPAMLAADLRRIAKATREQAEQVYRARGRRAVGQSKRQLAEPVWRAEVDGAGTVRYRINRDHLAVGALLERIPRADRRLLSTVLRTIEQNVPTAHILSTGYQGEERLDADGEPGDVAEDARTLFARLIDGGLEPEAARAALASAEPFSRFPEIIGTLEGPDE